LPADNLTTIPAKRCVTMATTSRTIMIITPSTHPSSEPKLAPPRTALACLAARTTTSSERSKWQFARCSTATAAWT